MNLWWCFIVTISSPTYKCIYTYTHSYDRYADDTTLMAESEEELKSPLMKMKEESEKAGLKFNIQKIKGLFSSSSLSAIRVVSSAYLS